MYRLQRRGFDLRLPLLRDQSSPRLHPHPASVDLSRPLIVPFARAPAPLSANFEWERIGEVVAPTEPKAENCPATPTKWVLAGHSLGSLAMEKVCAEGGCRGVVRYRACA